MLWRAVGANEGGFGCTSHGQDAGVGVVVSTVWISLGSDICHGARGLSDGNDPSVPVLGCGAVAAAQKVPTPACCSQPSTTV